MKKNNGQDWEGYYTQIHTSLIKRLKTDCAEPISNTRFKT